MGETKRLFIGIPLPAETQEALAGNGKIALDACMQQGAKCSLVPEGNFHITLLFLGDVSEDQEKRVIETLEKVDFTKFQITLTGYGFFTPKSLRVVFRATDNPPEAMELHSKVVEQATKALHCEDGKFHSHVTLLRVKEEPKNTDSAKAIKEFLLSASLAPKTVLVDRFCLFESVFEKGKVRYNVVRQFALTERGKAPESF